VEKIRVRCAASNNKKMLREINKLTGKKINKEDKGSQ
jgi:hypothetical protein